MAKLQDLPLNYLEQRLRQQMNQSGSFQEVDSNGYQFFEYKDEIARRVAASVANQTEADPRGNKA